jgi:uncharacterized protein YjiS (DUF1127 family)
MRATAPAHEERTMIGIGDPFRTLTAHDWQRLARNARAERAAALRWFFKALAATPISAVAKAGWTAFQHRYERARLRAAMHRLSDRDLSDIGIARAEIGHLVTTRASTALARAR